MTDEELLVQCDSLLSLIRYREPRGISEQTARDIDKLLGMLRKRTDEIAQNTRETNSSEPADEMYWKRNVTTGLYECRQCGATTGDPRIHDIWHTSQYDLIKSLSDQLDNHTMASAERYLALDERIENLTARPSVPPEGMNTQQAAQGNT